MPTGATRPPVDQIGRPELAIRANENAGHRRTIPTRVPVSCTSRGRDHPVPAMRDPRLTQVVRRMNVERVEVPVPGSARFSSCDYG
jgi:hypothetical protein